MPVGVNTHWVPAQLHTLSYHDTLDFIDADVLDSTHSPISTIAIDMPIGLADGPRACDTAARRLLSPHAARVFPAPPRAALAHIEDYDAACAAARSVSGKALSRQTWNLLRSIAAVDARVSDERLVECHPEVSFALMQGYPLDERKKTPAGRSKRLELLRRWIPNLDDPLFGDDGLDALACAWSAARIAAGVALTLPPGAVPQDALNRPMRIVA